jgi:WhiB family redox-sensing transcriptional regulator
LRYITSLDAPTTGLRGAGDISWQQHGACNDLSPKVADRLFFPTARNFAAIAQAKAICARCPVQDTCLNAALDTGTREGIWGGRTEAERRHLHAKTAHRLEDRRVRAAIAGRDIPLSTRERQAVAREAVLRGWSRHRLAAVLGFTPKHARDLLSQARHELQQTDDAPGLITSAGPQQNREADLDDVTGADEFDALEGPTDAELAEQAQLLGQAA